MEVSFGRHVRRGHFRERSFRLVMENYDHDLLLFPNWCAHHCSDADQRTRASLTRLVELPPYEGIDARDVPKSRKSCKERISFFFFFLLLNF